MTSAGQVREVGPLRLGQPDLCRPSTAAGLPAGNLDDRAQFPLDAAGCPAGHRPGSTTAVPGRATVMGWGAPSVPVLPSGRDPLLLSEPRHILPSEALTQRRALMLMSLRDRPDRAPLAQQIFDDLAIAIIEGRLVPGDTLNSVELAKRFSTSRTPVREALADLERQRVVVVPPRRRPYVAPVTLEQMKDNYDIRGALLTLVSELIVERCGPAELAELWAWQAALEDDVARGSSDDYFWHDVGYRLAELRLTGNEDLQRIMGDLGLRTLQFRHLSLSRPGRIALSAADHRRLLLAYEDRDRESAAAVVRKLNLASYRGLQRSGVFAQPASARLPVAPGAGQARP